MAAEQAAVPDAVMRKFAELDYEIETAARDYTITGANRYSVAGVDILLQDGDTVILVEIKTKMTKAHIDRAYPAHTEGAGDQAFPG